MGCRWLIPKFNFSSLRGGTESSVPSFGGMCPVGARALQIVDGERQRLVLVLGVGRGTWKTSSLPPQPCMESLLELREFPQIPSPPGQGLRMGLGRSPAGTGGTLLSHGAEAPGRHFMPLENHKSLNILFPREAEGEGSSQARWVVGFPSVRVCGVNERPWMEQIPRFGSFGTYPNVEKPGGSFQHPQSPGTAVSPRGRVPPQPGCAVSGLTKLSLEMILPLGSSGTTFFALILLGFAWIRSWSSRAARLDFTRGRRNFRLGARRGLSGKVGCLLLLFNQLERCRVELEVTGRGSRLVSGRGRIC